MKIKLSRKQKFSAVAIFTAIILGGVVAGVPDSGSTLQKMEEFMAKEENPITEEQKRQREQMRAIREQGASIHKADEEGYTPLMNAARLNALQDVRYLLVRGARIQQRGPEGKTALDLATNEDIRTLLQRCELVDSTPDSRKIEEMKNQLRQAQINPDNTDQLVFACRNQWRGDRLLNYARALAIGAAVNSLNEEGKHILECDEWNPNILTLLLRKGADPNAVLDDFGASRVLPALINSSEERVELIMACNPSVKGPNVVAAAAGAGNADMVSRLIKSGADVKGMADSGWSVLEHAVRGDYDGESRNKSDFKGTIEALLQAGAPTEITTPSGEVRSPLSPGAMSIRPDSIRALVEAGADVNALNNRGANYAQIAVYKSPCKENLELLEDIISKGSDLQHVDAKGENFLIYALSTICNINIKSDDEDEREEAEDLLEDYLDIVDDSAPDPDLLDKNGNTALHLAAIKNGQSLGKVLEYLLKLGVDPEAKNKFGRTALDVLIRDHAEAEYADAFKVLVPVSPEPEDERNRLKAAILAGDTEMAEEVLEASSNKNLAAEAIECATNAETLTLLLEHGAKNNYTFASYIAGHGTPEMVEILAEFNQLEPISHYWSDVKSAELAAALLEHGLTPPSIDSVQTADILKILLEQEKLDISGVALNVTGYYTPRLPLQVAAQKDDVEMVQLLLDSGAPVNGYPESPLNLTSNADIAKLLISHGADVSWRDSNGNDLVTLRRNRLEYLAERYSIHKDDSILESFEKDLEVYHILQKYCDIPAPHPRREEIKKALQQRHCDEEYETVIFEVDGWRGKVRINKEAMVYARNSPESKDAGNILDMTSTRLEIKWDRWGHGIVEKGKDNVYRKVAADDKYEDFLKSPTRHPHFTADFVNEKEEKSSLYFSTDYGAAVRADTGEGRFVRGFAKGNYRQVSNFKWTDDHGKTTHYYYIRSAFHALNAQTAKHLLGQHNPPIAFKDEHLFSRSWDDRLRFSEEYRVAIRYRNQDSADVQEYSEKCIILKWDNWGTEIFYRHPDGSYYSPARKLLPEHAEIREKLKRNDPTLRSRKLTLVHPAYTGQLVCSFKDKIAMLAFEKPSFATIMDFSRNHITLKWDNFGVERFERGSDRKFHLKK